MIASLSGIRGIVNSDLSLDDVARFSANFASAAGSREVLLGRDTRATGPAMARAASYGILSAGVAVRDFGVISTPAMFRQSRIEELPAVILTASHNEPEFNGMKFLLSGAGVGADVFDSIVSGAGPRQVKFGLGAMKSGSRPSYVGDLVERFGAGSCSGVKVAMDLGGGAAIAHSHDLMRRLGCDVVSLNDSSGVFSRRIDPVADGLDLLRETVQLRGCDIGFGFDCDGDRLVIVDSKGRKRTGDFMLTLALSEMIRETREKKVVVSLDTTQAVDDIAKKAGAEVFRTKVGEANVVSKMKEKGARLGGEGSSGGLIDGSFNYCRDSMLAGIVIAKALKRDGRKLYESVPVYHQERVVVKVSRKKVQKAIKALSAKGEVDLTDGVKVKVSARSWVLVRPSGTEDLVRVSAEAETSAKAETLANSYARKVAELSG